MARWIYAALALGWVLSMIYECVQTGTGAALYFSLGVIGLTAFVILFVRDLTRGGEQKPVPRMVHFLGAAISAALFYRALSKAAYAGTYVQFMPFYLVMFAYFLGAGLYLWWKALREKR